MRRIKINLNQEIIVRITPKGQKVIEKHIDELNLNEELKQYATKKMKPDSQGYLKLQLWQFNNLFKECFTPAAPEYFDMTIQIV